MKITLRDECIIFSDMPASADYPKRQQSTNHFDVAHVCQAHKDWQNVVSKFVEFTTVGSWWNSK